MKAGFERGHERQVRKAIAEHPHRLGVGRIVGGSDVGEGLHRLEHVIVNPMDPGQVAGMDRLEPDGRHVTWVGQHADVGIGELVEAKLDRVAMVGDRPIHLPLAPGGSHDDPGHRAADRARLPPCARTGSAGSLTSKSRYLKLVDPRLATRIFNVAILPEIPGPRPSPDVG